MKKLPYILAIVFTISNNITAQSLTNRLSELTTHEKVGLLHAQSKFTSAGVPRLGIPQLNMDDGPHGVREELEWNTWSPAHQTNDSCTAFPSLTCLAATWNRELSSVYGKNVSEEFAYRGKNVMLGPGVTMARHPLCGRNFEYMGEDPYLAGEMVVPYIVAAQNNGVACCIKHFFLNNQEQWRFGVNVVVSERAVEEIYLPAFEKAVKKGHVWSIMPSYNKWLNTWNCENDSLLNGILKKRWGFDGCTISDWGGTHTTMGAAFGGLDIEMGTDTNGKTIDSSLGYNTYRLANPFENLINEGKIPMSILNDKATRVLRLIERSALNPKRVIGSMCSEAHYAACQQIGEEGIVLLKNVKAMLPLTQEKAQGKHILVVGDNATRNMSYGGGSSELKTKMDISPLEGLKAVYGADIEYAQGYYAGRSLYNHVDKVPESLQDSLYADAIEKAKKADIIIFVGGLNKNHHQDCEDGDRLSYNLDFGQDRLIAELSKIQKNIIVVTYGGNAFATPWSDKVAAMLHCWYLGSMSGTTLANVLSGKVNPSGKLPVTFAKRQADYACFQNGEKGYPGIVAEKSEGPTWGGEGKTVYYDEGIYIGYRHFTTKKVTPAFPFGFGLSYTTFAYGKASMSTSAEFNLDACRLNPANITISVPVTNTGKVEGKEIVQLYISPVKSSVDRPLRELKGFDKISLQPGETKTVTLTLTTDDLRYFDQTTHQWTLAPGAYRILVGASSEDMRASATVIIM